jgi:hypothetical protein
MRDRDLGAALAWRGRRWIPAPMYYGIRQGYRKVDRRFRGGRGGHRGGADRSPARRDVAELVIDDGTELHVFWKVLPIGRGPALALLVLGEEVLKFDCFGPGRGHFHARIGVPRWATSDRMELFEQSAPEQLDRAIHEMTVNLAFFLERHPWKRVRTWRVDQAGLERACRQARSIALGFLDSVPELHEMHDRVLQGAVDDRLQ